MGSALIMGVLGTLLCHSVAHAMKRSRRFDDTLDAWSCHGVGGTLGTILTGFFASEVSRLRHTDRAGQKAS